ncbi:WXG100 family type VII secretion target [Isoptericola croceus]|uniref:WXG100 family type VII secretion target n=1 Tax=Isoptericola croceus TaxID=3031406 RepID=UPI0023F9A500|nr:WXG100 family type VII secretion target [Isoptericola croceus]
MSNVNVTYSELETQRNQLGLGKEAMMEALRGLQVQIDTLVTSGFQTDTASAAFQDHYMQFQQGMQRALLGLDGMENFLMRAEETMKGADEALRAQLG